MKNFFTAFFLCLLYSYSQAQCWESVYPGGFHTLAKKTDGTLWAWGVNWYGQLGNGSLLPENAPTRIDYTSQWRLVVSGTNNNLAIKNDGTLWGWGVGEYGQLGDSTLFNHNEPLQIGQENQWLMVSASGHHTLAIKNDHSLWSTGLNNSGELGYPISTWTQTTFKRVGTENNWTMVKPGGNFSLAQKSNGTLWSSGGNMRGQLGRPTPFNQDQASFGQIGNATDWIMFSAGVEHALAIKSDHTLWAWGDNRWGELGIGSITTPGFNVPTQDTPIQVGNSSDWVEVSCGGYFTLARKSDGSIWGWGFNTVGQLGLGEIGTRIVPVRIGQDFDWISIAAGNSHGTAMKADGTIWTWGSNEYGQLGDGTNTNRLSPVKAGQGSGVIRYPLSYVEVYDNLSASPAFTGSVVYSNPCCNNSSVTYSDDETVDCCSKLITRTWTIGLCSGINESWTQTIKVISDTTAPQISCAPIAPGCNYIPTPSEASVTVSDSCPVGLTVVSSSAPGTNPCETIYTFVWTATDMCGNEATCTQIALVINDTEEPEISCPAPTTLACNAIPSPNPADVIATDNCGPPRVSLIETVEGPVLNCTKVYTFTWQARDSCGNSTTCEQIINVPIDEEEPEIIGCPVTLVVANAPGLCGAQVFWTEPEAIDNCGIDTLTSDYTSGSFFPVGTTDVTYTAMDKCGKVTQCFFSIVIVDVELPTLSQSNISGCDSIYNYTPVMSDNCGIVSQIIVPPSGSVFPVGKTKVTMEASDADGNTRSGFFYVTRFAYPETPDSLVSASRQICLGDSLMLRGKGGIKGSDGHYAYYLSTNAGPVFLDSGDVVKILPSDTLIYTFLLRIEAYCDTTDFVSLNVKVKNCCSGPPNTSAWTKPKGDDSPCKGTIQGYRLPSIPNSDSIVWSVPSGYTIVTGQGSDSINVEIPNSAAPGAICAKAVNHCGSSAVVCLPITFRLIAPSFSLSSGTYDNPQMVTISKANEGGLIYYSTTGNYPVPGTSFTKLYSGPFSVFSTSTIRAIIVKDCVPNSPAAVLNLNITNPGIVSKPTILPGTGIYGPSQTVTLNCETTGAKIYYTTSGNNPLIGASFTKLYTGPFTLQFSATVRAIGVKTGLLSSGVAVSYITITSPASNTATPVISPATGSFPSPQTVTIGCTTPGSTIYYTTNGNVPVVGTPTYFTKLYSGPFVINQSTTIRAIATATGFFNSGVSVSVLTLPPPRQSTDFEYLDNEKETFVRVMPNPSSNGIFKFEWGNNEKSATRLEIRMADGKSILSESIPENQSSYQADLSKFPSGIYFVQILSGKKKSVLHISKL